MSSSSTRPSQLASLLAVPAHGSKPVEWATAWYFPQGFMPHSTIGEGYQTATNSQYSPAAAFGSTSVRSMQGAVKPVWTICNSPHGFHGGPGIMIMTWPRNSDVTVQLRSPGAVVTTRYQSVSRCPYTYATVPDTTSSSARSWNAGGLELQPPLVTSIGRPHPGSFSIVPWGVWLHSGTPHS